MHNINAFLLRNDYVEIKLKPCLVRWSSKISIVSDKVSIEHQMLRLYRERLNVLLCGMNYLMLGEGFGQQKGL